MKLFTAEEVKSWCHPRGLKVTDDRYLSYALDSPHCFTLGLEEKPSRVIALADYLVPTWKDVPFEGALLWVRERGIWGDYSEHTAEMIFQQMRQSKGEHASLEECPGHLFGPKELFELHSFFVVPMLFGWDAFVIPENGDYFIFVSHDGIAEVVGRTLEIAAELRGRVQGWNPQEDRSWYPRLARGNGVP